MNIGIIGDTHGNERLMHKAVDVLMAVYAPKLFLHLGDDYADGEALASAGYDVHIVPGTRCREYFDPRVPNVRVEAFDGLSVAYGHVDDEVAPFADQAALLLHGHSHRARVVWEDGRIWVNPGHLRSRNERGQLPSCGVMLLDDAGLTLVVHELDETIRIKEHIPRAAWPVLRV